LDELGDLGQGKLLLAWNEGVDVVSRDDTWLSESRVASRLLGDLWEVHGALPGLAAGNLTVRVIEPFDSRAFVDLSCAQRVKVLVEDTAVWTGGARIGDFVAGRGRLPSPLEVCELSLGDSVGADAAVVILLQYG
jgi:hypothetical protein